MTPEYEIVAGGDADSFEITGDLGLNMTVSPTKSLYTVNITSTGSFGTSNHRIHTITVPIAPTNPAPVASFGDGDEVEGTGKSFDRLNSPYYITTVKIDSGMYALVTSSGGTGGVQIIDITDPANPLPASSFHDDETITVNGIPKTFDKLQGARGIATPTIDSKTYVLIAANGDDGIQIVDITDPANPLPVSSFGDGDAFDKLDGAFDITTAKIGSGTYAIATAYHDNGVQIINITDPANPVPVASFVHGDTVTVNGSERTFGKLKHPEGITTTTIGSDTYALVAAYQSDGVQIINITDPANPVPASSFGDGHTVTVNGVRKTFGELGGANGITTAKIGPDTYALVTAYDDDGVQIINITDPANPVPAASLDNGKTVAGKTIDQLGGAFGIDTIAVGSDMYALVASMDGNGVQIIDITDPTHPVPAASVGRGDSFDGKTFDELTVPRGITTAIINANAYALVASFLSDGIQIIDLGATPDVFAPPPYDSFVTTWQTISADEMITIPVSDAAGTYTVHWGDGNITTHAGDATHTYATAGNHTVSISGDFTRIYLAEDMANAKKIVSLDRWGNVRWESMNGAFYGASNMVYNATDAPDLYDVTDTSFMFSSAPSFDGDLSSWDVFMVTDMSGMFHAASSFDGELSSWDVSGVTDMNSMFEGAASFNRDISVWNVSSVTDMSGMFHAASSFDGELSSWDVSGVTDMNSMFGGAASFNQDISAWNIAAVTDTNSMFDGAASFNSDISAWNVSAVTDMSSMFYSAASFNSDISAWSVSRVTDTSSMFYGAAAFNHDISAWNVSRVTDMSDMFYGAATFNSDISAWNVSEVAYMSGMFNAASAFVQNLGNWYIVLDGDFIYTDDAPGIVGTVSAQNHHLDGQNPTYGIGTGSDADSFEITGGSGLSMTVSPTKLLYTVNITSTGSFGTSNHRIYNITVSNSPTSSQSSGGSFVTTWKTVSAGERITVPVNNAEGIYTVHWGDGNITTHTSDAIHTYATAGNHTVSISGDFARIYLADNSTNAEKIVSIDQWGDARWESMNGAFRGASNVTYNATDVPDLSGVLDMSSMFRNAASFDGDLSGWNVSGVSNMHSMFRGAASFDGDLSDWDVSGVDHMYNMFRGTASFDGDLSDWDVSGATHMDSMFTGAASFNGDLSTWNVSGVANMYGMFTGASAFRQNLGSWYVVLDSTSVRTDDASGIIGIISAQNHVLDDHNPTYSLGTGGDSDLFVITGDTLGVNLTADYSGKTGYSINITSTGDFGTGNHRVYDVTVTDADQIPDIAPTVMSIKRYDPAAENTGSQTLVYKVRFSEDVTGVGTDDFVLSSGSTGSTTTINPVTSISGSDDVYYVTVFASTDGTYNLDLVPSGHGIKDAADNLLTGTAPTTGTDHTYTVNIVVADSTAPALTSIERDNPAAQNTDSQILVYKVRFSEDVTGVGTDDFVLSSDSTGGGNNDTTTTTTTVTTSGQFTQTRSPSSPITDNHNTSDTITVPDSGTATSVSVTVNISHTYIGDLKVDLIAPEGTLKTLHNISGGSTDNIVRTYTPDFDGAQVQGGWKLKIRDNANSDVGTLNSWTLAVSYDAVTATTTTTTVSPATDISGSGDVYYVTVPALQDGTYNLDLVPSGHGIKDAADNLLTGTVPTTGTDHTYTVNIVVADSTVPALTSIERNNPAAQNTDSQILVYQVTFSEDVTGVGTDDFVLSSGSTGSTTTINPVTSISGSDDVYYVTVFASTDGTYNLDLVPSGHGIKDAADNLLTGTAPTTGTDHTYTVNIVVADSTVPALTSIERNNPAAQNTDSQTLVYQVTFSEDVTGVGTDDFVLSSGSTGSTTTINPVTSISGSGDVYYVTVFASTDGTYNLDLVPSGHGIKDAADNLLTGTVPTTGTDHTYTVNIVVADSTVPALTSIERNNPAAQNTDSQTLVYKVTFSEDVTGVDTNDFALSSDSTGGGSNNNNTAISSEQFTQTRSPVLAIPGVVTVSDTITVPDSGTATSVSVSVDIAHTWIGDLLVELIAPDGTAITLHDRGGGSADDIDQTYAPDFEGVLIAGNWTLRIDDNFVDDSGVLNSWTLTVNYGNAATATTTTTVTDISGSDDVYYVTVSALQDGTYNLDLILSGHGIKDVAENLLADTVPTTGTDHTYTVSTIVADSTAPALTSIERSSPAVQNTDSQTLVYKVTFSEDVTGVGTDDFVLSSGSTGGGNNNNNTAISSEQFAQTRSPALAISDLQTVSDTLTIPDSGTVTAVSVTVNISHTYIGDLRVEIVAPDGMVKTLHNISGSNTDNIIKTYTPNFDGTQIQGDWKLKIRDNANNDVGTLNSWTLAISYDTVTTTTTVSPVTDISGSDDVYYVTVSALQDGTYNLDLVSSGHGIKDAAENPLTDTVPTTGTDHTYTVSIIVADNTAPTLTSIERSNPAIQNTSSQTLIYKVTFSEDVTGLDTDDFVLSSGSTGGGGNSNNTVSSEQFTQTRSSPLVIPDMQTVSDTITVPDSGTATSVSVSVDITHAWIGDLLVDLIAPDGTTVITLHNRTGTDADNIVQTYEPDFGGVSITGNWTLRIDDNYDADPGVLNSWTLTVNYGNATTTTTTATSHIAGISGSGDVYHVTVSALQDGTYNLDLVSSGHGIADTADNHLTNTAPSTGTDHTYTVSTTVADSTAPTLTSIERSNPAAQNTDSQTLVYKVTFSENVTGVDASDFALSSGSTAEAGSANINGSSGQFTQTRSSPLVIPDMQTVSDIITIPDSGTATSVSVSVDITHAWIGDLSCGSHCP